mgnify:CR=1 FL=1
MSYTRVYHIWSGIKSRCCCPTCSIYCNYGGRGITICDEWKNSPDSFCKWALENGYSDDLTIDRINNDGNYEPSNCRWATYKQQSRNRRNNHLLTLNEETKTIVEWSEIVGIKADTIWRRIRNGMSIEKALTMPLQVNKSNRKKLC